MPGIGLFNIAITSGRSVAPVLPLFVFAGESNCGGYALNGDLSAGELAPRSVVRILNNTTLLFENLDIGTNNIIDHLGLDSTTHGLENGLANIIAAGRLSQTQVHLLKTGQGGDVIATWAAGHPSNYWSKFLTRWAAVQSLATGLGVTFSPYVFYSQGINDAIGYSAYAGGYGAITDPDVWKAATIAHFAKMRVLMGASTPIVMTKFQTPLDPRSTFNTKMDEIVAGDPLTVAMDTSFAGNRDDNHWNAAGFRELAERFIDQYIGGSALATPVVSPDGGIIVGSQSVSMSGPVGASIVYTQDGLKPLSYSTAYSAPISISTAQTINAMAVQRNKKNSLVEDSVFTVPSVGPTFNSADASGHFTLTNNNLTIRRSTSANAYRTVRITTTKTTGKWYIEIKLVGSQLNAFIIAGFATPGINLATNVGSSASAASVSSGARYATGFTAGTDARLNNASNVTNGFAIDLDAGKCWVALNNTWQLSGDPAAGTNPFATFTGLGALQFALSLFDAATSSDGTWTLQALSADQTYSPPSGFSPWA